MTARPRTKVQAAGGASVAAAVVAYVLRLAGVDVDAVPPEVLLGVGGVLATVAAYVKRDGLAGAWDRLVRGEEVS